MAKSTPAARHCLQPHAHRLHIVCTPCALEVHNLTPSAPPRGQGYFYSRNCLREVKATVKYGKSVVFVHEEDEARGGAPVEELALQCPAEYHQLQVAVDCGGVQQGCGCGTTVLSCNRAERVGQPSLAQPLDHLLQLAPHRRLVDLIGK